MLDQNLRPLIDAFYDMFRRTRIVGGDVMEDVF